MTNRLQDIVPSLLLAAGLMIATAVSVFAAGFGWMVMSGPAVLFVFMMAAGILTQENGVKGAAKTALLLGCGLLLAFTLVAWKAPLMVSMMMPILGSGAVVIVLGQGRSAQQCQQRI